MFCVCVECSLSPLNLLDCLRTTQFCKHSSSPIFNRNRRTLNRLPIYVGEDLCDIINREAVLKDLLNQKRRYSGEIRTKRRLRTNYALVYKIDCERKYGKYSLVNFPPNDAHWKQRRNGLIDNYCPDTTSAIRPDGIPYIQEMYEQRKNNRKRFKTLLKTLTYNRVMNQRDIWINKIYPSINEYIPTSEYAEQSIMRYIRRPNQAKYNRLFNEITRKRKTGYKWRVPPQFEHLYPERRINMIRQRISRRYYSEVCPVRINQYERYIRLYADASCIYEKTYYLLLMGQLKYNNYHHTELPKSREYSFLGTLKSHSDIHDFHRVFKHHKYFDYHQDLWNIGRYSRGRIKVKIYGDNFKWNWRNLIRNGDTIAIHYKPTYKKLYDEVIKQMIYNNAMRHIQIHNTKQLAGHYSLL